MKKILFVMLSFLLNCSLAEPSYLYINNNSDYNIDINFINRNQSKISIEKDKSDFILTSPGEIIIKITADEIKFEKEYKIELDYMGKTQFNFNIK